MPTERREKLLFLMKDLTDEQIDVLWDNWTRLFPDELHPSYDPAKDPLINGEFWARLDPSLYRDITQDQEESETV